MNRIMAAVMAASTVVVAGTASAQTRIESSIKSGTPVVLRTAEAMTGTDTQVKVGRTFALELAQPIESEGRTVIPAGTSATATIVSVKSSIGSQPGRIVARLQDLRFADRRIRLAGGLEGSGMGIATIPLGLTVRGYVDEDVMPDMPKIVVAAAPPMAEGRTPSGPVVVAETVVERHSTTVRDPAVAIVTKGVPQGSPALVALAPATAVARTPKVQVVTTRTVRTVRGVARADGVVDQGGVVTRYTY